MIIYVYVCELVEVDTDSSICCSGIRLEGLVRMALDVSGLNSDVRSVQLHFAFFPYSYFVMWPRGLKDEISSPAQRSGSWVRIPLEAWMFAFVFVLSCVGSKISEQ
jgi:hypothetical protein